jgi:hypothetical protein
MSRPAEGIDPVPDNEVQEYSSAKPSSPAKPRAHELSEEDFYAQQASETAERWRQKQNEIERQHHVAMRPVQEKLERAKKLVKESGVDKACASLLEIMWHWPSWSKRDDWKVDVGISDIFGSDNNTDDKEICWSEDGAHYKLHLKTSRYSHDSSRYGDILLFVNEILVLELDVSQELEDEYSRWRPFGVSAFRAGPWMVQINDLEGRLRASQQESLRANNLKYYSDKARNIDV